MPEAFTRITIRDLPEQYTPEQLTRQMKALHKKWSEDPMKNSVPQVVSECTDMQEVIEVGSLHVVGQALAYEPLRIYCSLVFEDASITEKELDKWTHSDKLSRLRRCRNSVFHVALNHPDKYFPSATIVQDNKLKNLGDLYTRLATFFGVYGRRQAGDSRA